MSTRFHVGAKSLQGPIAAYAKRFDLLEVSVRIDDGEADEAGPARRGSPKVAPDTRLPKAARNGVPANAKAALHAATTKAAAKTGAPAATTPTMSTLRKWRKQVPPHFDFSVVGGPHLARVRPSADLEREVAVALEAIAALQARCLVLRTPPDVTPSALWRERLEKLFARFPRDATNVVWEPSGLWETGDAAVLAKKCGVVLGVDAAREPVPAGTIAYVRLRAMGETRSFGESTLERIVRSIGVRRDVYVILETDSALEECKRLRRVAQRSKASTSGGMGRLVRPRGGIVVRDDEQE